MWNKMKLVAGVMLAAVVAVSVPTAVVNAAPTPTFNQTINAGVLSTDILDAALVPVAAPAFTMTAKNYAFTCQSGGNASTGLLGANAQRLYVINPGGANNGWTLTMAATAGPTALWTAGANTFDFNDAGGAGCTDAADTDTKGGQLTVDPSVSTLTVDCASCTTSNVTKGSSTAYVEGTANSVTLLNAAAASDDSWRGYITGAGLSQVIPAEQPAGVYSLNMTLTATAS